MGFTDSNLILVQLLRCSHWSEVKNKGHLVEYTACEDPSTIAHVGQGGRHNKLCQFSDSAHVSRKLWILVVGNNWSKGEITGTKWDTGIIWQWEERNNLPSRERTS